MPALAHFAIRLIFGMSLLLALMPRRDVAAAFFRIMSLLMLGMSVLFTLTTTGEKLGPISLAILSFAGSVVWTLERRLAGAVALWTIAVLAGVELFFSTERIQPTEIETNFSLLLFSTISSSLVLGATMDGMLLGHRYLTAPGMPLAPLIRMNLYLGIAAIFRLILSAAALTSVHGEAIESTAATWLGLRWLAGIIGPIIVCAMVWRILKYRNTQSATGVLFVGVILSFIGELTADLLFHELHVPL